MRSLIVIFSASIFLIISSSVNNSYAQSYQNKIKVLDKSEFIELNQVMQTQYNPWTIHRKIASIGLAGSIAATFVGALSMDDEFFATTVIPVVGPFITITRIENDLNSFYRPGGKQLLMASGIVQSAFLVYLVTSLIGESSYKAKHLTQRVSLSPLRTSKGIGISMNVRF